MKVDETSEFADPVLKAAVKRAWGEECCPFALRDRIKIRDSKSKNRAVSWMIWPASIAALIAIVAGVSILFHSQLSISSPPVAIALPVSFQNDLVACHDHCCKENNHQHLPVSKDDSPGITAEMKARLQQAVLVGRPSDPLWKFNGASICPVGQVPAGHLVFSRGGDSLSVFSLPQRAFPSAKDGQDFQIDAGDHPIAGFAINGALFCFVESGPASEVSVDQLRKVRDEMRAKVTTALANLNRTTLASLR